jgi:hypothetical protein
VKEAYQYSGWTKTAKSMATRLGELHFIKRKVFEHQLLYEEKNESNPAKL